VARRIHELFTALREGDRVVVPGPLGAREAEWTKEFGGLLTIYGVDGVSERTVFMTARQLNMWLEDCVRNVRKKGL